MPDLKEKPGQGDLVIREGVHPVQVATGEMCQNRINDNVGLGGSDAFFG